MKHKMCPCCKNFTLTGGFGNFEICPVCYWEDDNIQRLDPDYYGGANGVSLNEAMSNYKRYGVCDKRLLGKGRKPLKEELPENNQ